MVHFEYQAWYNRCTLSNMVWKGKMFVLDYFGTSMEAIMDDAPSNSITFPEIMLIQETIVKICLNHCKMVLMCFASLILQNAIIAYPKILLKKLSKNAWALNPHSQIISLASSPLHHETTEWETYSFHYIQHASPCHFRAKSAGVRRKIDGFSKITELSFRKNEIHFWIQLIKGSRMMYIFSGFATIR